MPIKVGSAYLRMISRRGTSPSSRRCTCQPASRPSRISPTAVDWKIIITGAIRPDINVSTTVPATPRNALPRRAGTGAEQALPGRRRLEDYHHRRDQAGYQCFDDDAGEDAKRAAEL